MGCFLSMSTSRKTMSASLVARISTFLFNFVFLGTAFLTSRNISRKYLFNGRLALTGPMCCSRCNRRHRRTHVVPLFGYSTIGQVELAHLKTYEDKNGSFTGILCPIRRGWRLQSNQRGGPVKARDRLGFAWGWYRGGNFR